MNVQNIINLSANFLGLSDVYGYTRSANQEAITFGDAVQNSTFLNEQCAKDTNLLIECVNIAYQKVATDFIPLFHQEEITISNGEIPISTLSKTLIKIKKITQNGIRQNYKIYNNTIYLTSGKYDIEYSYLPEVLVFTDNITNLYNNRLSQYALAYGVCAEYCTIRNNYEEAQMWSDKFENALENAKKQICNIVVPQRRWL